MRGEPVNMESLREEILNGAGKVEDFVRSPQTESKARGCLSTVVDLFAGLFKLLLFVFLGGLAVLFVFGLLLVICCIGMALYASIAGFGSLFFHNTDAVLLQTLEQLPLTANLGFWVSALSLLVLLAIPVYVFVHWLGRFWGRGGGVAPKARTTLIVSWLAALVLFGIFTTTTSITVARSYQENQRKLYSINGFYVPEWEYNYLKQNDWNVLVHKNCSDDYIGWGHYYSKDGQRYLHGRNVDGQMEYQLERKEKVTPGLYRLEAVGRTDGAGAYIYAQQGTSVNKQEIPVCGEEQGSIWLDAQKRIAADTLQGIGQTHFFRTRICKRVVADLFQPLRQCDLSDRRIVSERRRRDFNDGLTFMLCRDRQPLFAISGRPRDRPAAVLPFVREPLAAAIAAHRTHAFSVQTVTERFERLAVTLPARAEVLRKPRFCTSRKLFRALFVDVRMFGGAAANHTPDQKKGERNA